MYFEGGGNGNGRSSSSSSTTTNNNGVASNCWPFDEDEGEQRESGASGTPSPPSRHGTAFMQSLLDLQGFCADTKRLERRQQRRNNNDSNSVQDNCICLLHQILIKVVELCCGDLYNVAMNPRDVL